VTGAGSVPRWRRRPEERRPEIIQAAFQVFGEMGFQGATLAQIARRAGVSAGTLGFYFGSKQELFDATILEKATTVLQGQERLLLQHRGSYSELLRKLLASTWERMAEPGVQEFFLMMEAEFDALQGPGWTAVRQVSDQFQRLYTSIIEAGIKAGEFRQIDPEAVGRVVGSIPWGIGMGIRHAARCGQPVDRDALWNTALDLVMHSLKPELAAP
jgi:AcrR family transcriptional regulator